MATLTLRAVCKTRHARQQVLRDIDLDMADEARALSLRAEARRGDAGGDGGECDDRGDGGRGIDGDVDGGLVEIGEHAGAGARGGSSGQ